MIKLQQRNIRPDENRLRIIANIIINALWKNQLLDYHKIQQLRELNQTAPARALKSVAQELAEIISKSWVAEKKEGE